MSIQNDIWKSVKDIILANVKSLNNKLFFEHEQVQVGEYYMTAEWGLSRFDEVGTAMRQRITPLILTLYKKKGARSKDLNVYEIADTIAYNIPRYNAPTWYFAQPDSFENEVDKEGYIGFILTINFYTAECATDLGV